MRRDLLQRLDSARLSLVLGGVGLGKKTLLRQYHDFLSDSVLYFCGADDAVLGAFVSNFTHAVMSQTKQRFFEGLSSSYAQRTGEVQPELYARLIAQDLERDPQGQTLTIIIGLIPQSSSVLAFLTALALETLSVRFIFSGIQTLVSGLLLPDAQHIGPESLVFRSSELIDLGLEAMPELQGIPALADLYRAGPAYLEQFALQVAVAAAQMPDGEMLLAAGLLDEWSTETPVSVLQALSLPSDYLYRFQESGFPLGPVEQGIVRVPDVLLQALQRLLRDRGAFEELLLALSDTYGATDPLKAYLLRQELRPHTMTERQALLQFSRQHLTQWQQGGEWRRIREALAIGLYQTSRGLRFLLSDDEALLLVQAFSETAETLDELREARYLLALAETSLLLRQPRLGQIKGQLVLRLGYVEQAHQAYAEVLEMGYYPSSSEERTLLVARLCLCALQLDDVGLAWGWMTGTSSAASEMPVLYRVALAALSVARGLPSEAAQAIDAVRGQVAASGDVLALGNALQVLCDVGEIDQVIALLALWDESERPLQPWLRTELAFFRALVYFRQYRYQAAQLAFGEALLEARGLSRYSHRPEAEYHDVSFHIRVLTRQFLCAIQMMDLRQADQTITALENLMLAAPFLQRRIRLCKAIYAACRGSVPAYSRMDFQGYSELELVLRLLVDGPGAVENGRFPEGMLRNWRNWSPHAPLFEPSFGGEEIPAAAEVQLQLRRQLELRGLGVEQPVVRLDAQVLPLNLPQYAILAVLATGPKTPDELRTLLFADKSEGYLKTTLARLKKRCGEMELEPLHVFEDGVYRLAPDVDVNCDLQAARTGPLTQLPQVYQGPFCVDESWLVPFVSPRGLRQEIVQRLRGEAVANRVLSALLLVDADFREFLV